MTLDQLLRFMAERGASDVFLAAGSPVIVKVNGVCVPIGQERCTSDSIRAMLAARVAPQQFEVLDATTELSIALPLPGVGSFRLSAFKQRGSTSAVIRYIPVEVPALEALNLPSVFAQLAVERRGLVLLVGAAGSGKSTAIASMIDHRNQRLTGHILTLEDPIEFLFRNKQSIISQREIGTDAHSLKTALFNAMRQSPDLIFIGEIRDREAMAAALSYAMSGHLVLSTLHATNCAHALNRITSFFPLESRGTLFQDLAVGLRAIFAMRLVRSLKGQRVPAVEVMLNTGQITNLIERGDIPAVKEAVERSLSPGSQSFEQSLYALVKDEEISTDVALEAADSRTNLQWLLDNAAFPTAASRRTETPEDDAARHANYTEHTFRL